MQTKMSNDDMSSVSKKKKKQFKNRQGAEVENDELFNDYCSVCANKCNEMSGWKCRVCQKCFCDNHNTENFVCNC